MIQQICTLVHHTVCPFPKGNLMVFVLRSTGLMSTSQTVGTTYFFNWYSGTVGLVNV